MPSQVLPATPTSILATEPEPPSEPEPRSESPAPPSEPVSVPPLQGPGNLRLVLRILILALVLLAVLAAAIGAFVLIADARGEDETRDATVQVNPEPSFAVDTERGDIVVEGGPLGVISISARLRNVERVDYTMTEADGGVAITASINDALLNRLFSFDEPAADVAAVVASDAHISLSTGDGMIVASGIEGGGSLRAQNGSITLAQAAGAWLLETSNGAISALAVTGSLDASTSNGRIEAAASGAINLRTSNGSVAATSSLPAGSENVIETSNGNITLTVTGELDAAIVAQTSNGTVTIDGAAASGNSFEGTLGGGTAVLRLSTSNGNIRVIVMDS